MKMTLEIFTHTRNQQDVAIKTKMKTIEVLTPEEFSPEQNAIIIFKLGENFEKMAENLRKIAKGEI
jgi:hypothetical protein